MNEKEVDKFFSGYCKRLPMMNGFLDKLVKFGVGLAILTVLLMLIFGSTHPQHYCAGLILFYIMAVYTACYKFKLMNEKVRMRVALIISASIMLMLDYYQILESLTLIEYFIVFAMILVVNFLIFSYAFSGSVFVE